MNQAEAMNIVKPHLYKKNNNTMINFEGTRSDYTVPMIFQGVTPSGNLRVREVTGTKEGGIPDKFRNRVAQLRKKTATSGHYWWIEDGTGSLIFKPNQN